MDKWIHPLEPPTLKGLPTAVSLAITLLAFQVEHVRLMEHGASLHLSVNVSTTSNFSQIQYSLSLQLSPSQ